MSPYRHKSPSSLNYLPELSAFVSLYLHSLLFLFLLFLRLLFFSFAAVHNLSLFLLVEQ